MDNLLNWQTSLPNDFFAAEVACVQSLTAALRGLGAEFSVQLLYLGNADFDPVFAGGLQRQSGQNWFARDVLLCLNSMPVVWARSMCHGNADKWSALLDCGSQPLGERLFDGSLPLSRSPFEYTDISPAALPQGLVSQMVLARRSFFDWEGQALGLVECFLPDLSRFLSVWQK